MRKTLTQGIKIVILDHVISSVKFPLHLYNAVAIKQQFPVSENRQRSTLRYQMLLRTSGMLQMVLLLPCCSLPLGRRYQPGGQDPAGQGLPGHPLLPVGWGESTSLPRLCEQSGRRKSMTPLAGARTTVLSAASLLSPEKWSAREWGRRSHPGCWHGVPRLGC